MTAVLGGLSVGLSAEAPKLEQLFPAGGVRGTTNAVVAVGKFDTWPVEVWMDAPGLVFRPEKDNGKFSVEVAANAEPGPRLVRMFNKDGATALRFFVVGEGREILEVEPNDGLNQGQAVSGLPLVVNGRLEKNQDVDGYAVDLVGGQWLIASLDAYRLTSPMDALMRVVDAEGRPVTMNHDGRILDPFIAWQAPSTGRFTVQVMAFPYPANNSVNLAGGGAYVYRLNLTTGPYLRNTKPLVLQAGGERSVAFEGWSLGVSSNRVSAGSVPVTVPLYDPTRPHFVTSGVGALNRLRVLTAEDPSVMQGALERLGTNVFRLAIPGGVSSCLQVVGEEHRYRFTAKKGDRFEWAVLSGVYGFPLDAWLKIEDLAGKELVRDDDAGGWGDPRLEWTAPADGEFVVAIGSLVQRGGVDYQYHLMCSRPKPSVRATVAENVFVLEAGKTNEVKIAIGRKHGQEKAYRLRAVGLPASVVSPAVEVGAKAGEAVLKWWVHEDVSGWNGAVRFVLGQEGAEDVSVWHELISTSENNGVPGGFRELLVNETDSCWLTVLPKPPAKPAEPAKAK